MVNNELSITIKLGELRFNSFILKVYEFDLDKNTKE